MFKLLDFKDLYEAVLEQLKIPVNDTTTLNRIKRDINMIYVNEVAPACRWSWLTKRKDIVHKAYINTGTANVGNNSATVILSNAPTVSLKGYKMVINGHPEVYKVESHTASTTTVTLSSVFTGTTNTVATFKAWSETIALPTNCRETFDIRHDWQSRTLLGVGPQKFDEIMSVEPLRESRPQFYSTDDFFDPSSEDAETEDDRYRVVRLYPSLFNQDTTLHVSYIQEVDALNLDADEPLLPIEDRIVLVYGALKQAWIRERNPETAAINATLFATKIADMKARYEDSSDFPTIEIDSVYTAQRRNSWRRSY